MIIADFANFLKKYNDDLMTHKTSPLKLLNEWLYEIVNKKPKNNVEKIIHREILYCKNNNGDYLIVGKSDSGRKLVTSLINFAKSYENYNYAKWLEMVEQKYHK